MTFSPDYKENIGEKYEIVKDFTSKTYYNALDTTAAYLLGMDNVVVAENEEDYKVVLPKEDIQIINEIRKNPKLVEYLREDPKRRVEYISKIKNI